MNNRPLRKRYLSLLLAAVALAGPFLNLSARAWRQDSKPSETLLVTGDIPTPVGLKAEDLDKMQPESVTVNEEDASTNYTGVTLRSVLEKAGAPMGKSLRGKGLASYVLAKARDGYQVVFTPGELDASFGNERVLIAYKREGKALFGYQGPFRIICPNDKAGARSIRMLESLEVVRLRK